MRLLEVTRARAGCAGSRRRRPGNRVGDISHAIQRDVEAPRLLGGARAGGARHRPRDARGAAGARTTGAPGEGPRLDGGQVLAIEPMVNVGSADVVTQRDGWTVVTEDGAL